MNLNSVLSASVWGSLRPGPRFSSTRVLSDKKKESEEAGVIFYNFQDSVIKEMEGRRGKHFDGDHLLVQTHHSVLSWV